MNISSSYSPLTPENFILYCHFQPEKALATFSQIPIADRHHFISFIDGNDQSPLYAASWGCNPAVVDLLLQNGADPNQPLPNRFTPLDIASVFGHLPVVQRLLSAGASVDSRAYCDETPLWRAAFNNHSDVIHVLLAAGADPNFPNRLGTTPLDIARRYQHRASVGALLAAGAKRSAQIACDILQLPDAHSLRELSIDCFDMFKEHAALLSELLECNTSIASLSLEQHKSYFGDEEGVRISDDTGIALDHLLSRNATLRSLLVHDCLFSSAECQGLRDALRSNSTLATLCLSDNQFTPGNFEVFISGLQHNVALTAIDLSTTFVDDSGGWALAEVIAKNSALESLILREIGISTQIALAFGDALRSNTTLLLLDLAENEIDFSQIHYVVEGDWYIRKNMSLYSLLLSDIEFDP